MINVNAKQQGLTGLSLFFLIFELVWSIGIFLMTYGVIVTPWLRWGITGLWAVGTVILGIIDFSKPVDDSRDSTAFDRWTIVHAAAGVVFGVWFIPLFYVLIVIIVWECFEFSVAGFGDQEVILNRVVDVSVAAVGWLLVVFIAIAVTHAPFPVFTPNKPAT